MRLAINGGPKEIIGDIKELWKDIQDEDIVSIENYLKYNPLSVIDGGILTQFENEFAKFVGSKYAVAFCNGTAALHAASFACGANNNSVFLLSEYGYHGTVNSLLENSAEACLCNYDRRTLNIDLDSAECLIGNRTQGIIITHCWGNPVDMDKVKEIKQKFGIKIISDASHAHGAKWEDKYIGGLESEDIACFSLGKNKLITGGELGIATTNDANLYDAMLFIGHPNRVPSALITNRFRNYSNSIGNKYRPHALGMVLASNQIKRYSKKKSSNIMTNKYLSTEINNIPGFSTYFCYQKAERVYWKLVVRLDTEYWGTIRLEKIVNALNAEGVILEQFHNYNIQENEYLWSHDRYCGRVDNKANIAGPLNNIILPGYICLSEEQQHEIVNSFIKISENKRELI